MIKRLLIANRGEIAVRVARTARRLGVHVIAVYSEADAGAMHVEYADEAVCIGPEAASESYLNIEAVIAAARATRADAIHPGYGFLSENARFAEACDAAGLIFVGPSADAMRSMGDKATSKSVMEAAGVPLVPGYHGDDQSFEALAKAAAAIGFPVLIKASAGGGGRGMRIAEREGDFSEALDSARREAMGAFGDDRVLIEKYLTMPRHIEVQVFGDNHGNAIHLFERDCSLQRRYQKVVEEAPAPGMDDERRAEIGNAAVAAAKAINYAGAGTVEFIVDATDDGANGPFYFMEMNTRLQVEHPVTEYVTGFDLVDWQLQVANGDALPVTQHEVTLSGHAIEVRLYAEDPARDFLPAPGHVVAFEVPIESTRVRVDTGVRSGGDIAVAYDPMIAKVIAHGADRNTAIAALDGALADLVCAGPTTNQAFLRRAITHPDFVAAKLDTGFIGRHADSLIKDDEGSLRPALIAVCADVLQARRHDATKHAEAGGEPGSPWSVPDGWRANLKAREVFVFTHVDDALSVAVLHDGDVVHLGLPDGSTATLPQDRHIGWKTYRTENTLFAVCGGTQVRLERVVAVEQDAAQSGSVGNLNAPMPGKIVSVAVSVGDVVTKGQTLLVLEAMKMEHAIKAPADGVVGDVFLKAGDQVTDGVELIRLEPVETKS